MKTVGIIGFGSFGRFLAERLDPYVQVRVYSYSGKGDKWKTSLDVVASSDYVILAIPLDAYENALRDIKDKLRPDSIIVDVCSVKVEPIKLIKRILPDQPLAATHPLFGPESAKDELNGHVIALCPEASDPGVLDEIGAFSRRLELEVVRLSAEEHDKEMAVVQGLTFFIAHALKDMRLHEQRLSTPSFQKLLALAKLESHHSYELFETIQSGNPYTPAMRKRFIELCEELDKKV